MFEFHGWATLQDSPGDVDVTRLSSIVDQVWERVRATSWGSAMVDVRWISGSPQLHLAGFPNRPHGTEGDAALNLFGQLAELAPGSYGLLYVHDDEAPEHGNDFRVFVLRRGQLVEQPDPFLSPVIPTIEDA